MRKSDQDEKDGIISVPKERGRCLVRKRGAPDLGGS